MKNLVKNRESERGSAATKFLINAVILFLLAHAAYNYIQVAFEGANLREDMDTAVIKAIATTGQLKPMDIVKSSLQRAVTERGVPSDAFIEIKPAGTAVVARVAYNKPVNILPFGIYKYNYAFDYTAKPTGYLLKD